MVFEGCLMMCAWDNHDVSMISKGPQYQVLSASMVKQLAREQNDVGYGRLCRRYTSHLHTVYNLFRSTINISRVSRRRDIEIIKIFKWYGIRYLIAEKLSLGIIEVTSSQQVSDIKYHHYNLGNHITNLFKNSIPSWGKSSPKLWFNNKFHSFSKF